MKYRWFDSREPFLLSPSSLSSWVQVKPAHLFAA
jgi:hypothetical protein